MTWKIRAMHLPLFRHGCSSIGLHCPRSQDTSKKPTALAFKKDALARAARDTSIRQSQLIQGQRILQGSFDKVFSVKAGNNKLPKCNYWNRYSRTGGTDAVLARRAPGLLDHIKALAPVNRNAAEAIGYTHYVEPQDVPQWKSWEQLIELSLVTGCLIVSLKHQTGFI